MTAIMTLLYYDVALMCFITTLLHHDVIVSWHCCMTCIMVLLYHDVVKRIIMWSRYLYPTISLSVTLTCKVKQRSYTVENIYLSRYLYPTISLSVTLTCKVKQRSYTVENMIFRFCKTKIHILDTATLFV